MWFVMLQHGPGLQGPLMKLLGQLHLATSNVSLQRQMLMAAAHTQVMLQAARYSQIQTRTHCDVLLWDEKLVWVGLICGQFESCQHPTAYAKRRL